MADTPAPTPRADVAPTFDECLASAARLLRHAEGETNHATMERLERLADSWTAVARTLLAAEQGG